MVPSSEENRFSIGLRTFRMYAISWIGTVQMDVGGQSVSSQAAVYYLHGAVEFESCKRIGELPADARSAEAGSESYLISTLAIQRPSKAKRIVAN